VALQEAVRVDLVVGELQDVRELRLVLAGGQVPADAADPEPQEQQTDRDAQHPDADEHAGVTDHGGVRVRVVGVRIVRLLQDQPVQVRADRLVDGGQLGSERRAGLRVEGERGEQVTDGGPLPDEQLEVGVLGRRVADVQRLQREQLTVDRGQQAGVERTEQPGPLRGLGGQGGLFPGGVRGVDVPGQLAGHDRGGQLVVRDRVALVLRRAGIQNADGGDRDHHQRERDAERYERAGRGSSKRPHSAVLTRRPAP
jgi:hypothetical protein